MMMKKAVWGKNPEFWGPRDWFRNSLLLKEIKARGERGFLLDFGCGSGNLLIRLAREHFLGKGIDASSLAVKFLRKRVKKESLIKKIKVVKGKENFLFKTKDRFNVIVSGETLEHLENDERAVQGFYRSLKRGGICVVSVPSHKWLWDINDDFSGHYRRYEESDLRILFKTAGFKIEKVYYWGFPVSFLWHKLIYLPLIKKEVETGKVYVNNSGFLGKILSWHGTKRIFSIPFWLDQLFNWTRLGGGLILIARK